MREINTKIGGKRVKLVASWRASIDVAEQVADPLMIVREAMKEQAFAAKALTYKPAFVFTPENIVQILHIGAVAGGYEGDLDDMGELVFKHGFMEAELIAGEYLGIIVTPNSKEAKKGDSGDGGKP